MFRIVLIGLIIMPSISLACSFAQNYRDAIFLVTPTFDKKPAPELPVIQVSSITRGYNDGNYVPCSDAGIIELKVDTNEVGYQITTIEPEEHKSTIPDGLYGAVKEGNAFYIRFIWLDGFSNNQEPLLIRLAVRAMSQTGELSESVELQIEHLGGKLD